jgi:hypothetical protein
LESSLLKRTLETEQCVEAALQKDEVFQEFLKSLLQKEVAEVAKEKLEQSLDQSRE